MYAYPCSYKCALCLYVVYVLIKEFNDFPDLLFSKDLTYFIKTLTEKENKVSCATDDVRISRS